MSRSRWRYGGNLQHHTSRWAEAGRAILPVSRTVMGSIRQPRPFVGSHPAKAKFAKWSAEAGGSGVYIGRVEDLP
jgi:hypothetical protein